MYKLNMNLLKFGTIGMLFEPKDNPDWVRVCFVRLNEEREVTEIIEDFYYDTAVGEIRHIKTESGKDDSTEIDAYLKICRDIFNYTFQFCKGSRYYCKEKSAFFELNYTVGIDLDNACNITGIDDWLNKHLGYSCIGDDTDGLEVGALESFSSTDGRNFQKFQYCFDINPYKEESIKAKFTIDNGASDRHPNIIKDALSKGNKDKKSTKHIETVPKLLDYDGWFDFPETGCPYFDGDLLSTEGEDMPIGHLMLQIQIE